MTQMNRYCALLAIAAITAAETSTLFAADLPAFPGAEGYGSTTIGGRGGKVIEVTNLLDHGPGSLRDAIEADFPRTIIFRISGTIPLEKDLEISTPYCTVAGQTAPGDGICLRNYKFGVNGTHDVVIRYIRVRRGDESRLQDDGLSVYENTKTRKWSENVIIDHCSVSWTCDEAINTWHHTRNVTYQWCIVSEALHDSIHVGHGFAATLGGENNLSPQPSRQLPWPRPQHRRQQQQLQDRQPRLGATMSSSTGKSRTLDGKPWSINVINNYFKPGPMTTLKDRFVRMDKINSDPQGYWYVGGNYYDGNEAITQNNRKGVEADGGLNPDDFLLPTPRITAPVNTQSAVDCYPLVLADAGATLPKRDPVDTRVIDEVRTGKPHHNNGIVNSQTDVGGWPELQSTEPPADTDHDGIPDWWEKKYGLNPNDPADATQDKNGDGYTNLEKYLNGLDPNAPKVDWGKPENNKSKLTPDSLKTPAG